MLIPNLHIHFWSFMKFMVLKMYQSNFLKVAYQNFDSTVEITKSKSLSLFYSFKTQLNPAFETQLKLKTTLPIFSAAIFTAATY